MKEMIACCGINCELCEARIATIHDDDDMRSRVAEEWSKMFQAPDIVQQSINCTGCRMPGIKFSHCMFTCEIRKCVMGKGFATCADCTEIDGCTIVGPLFGAVPDARENLRRLLV
jgi:hypothetical protein